MPRPLAAWLLIAAVTAVPTARPCHAQGTQADYDRADALASKVRGKVTRMDVRPNWLEGGSRFWYRVDLGDDRAQFILVDAEAGSRAPAFDQDRLAAALFARTGQRHDADQLPFRTIDFPADGVLGFSLDGKGWRCDLETYNLTEASADDAPEKSTVRVLGGIRPERGTGEETQITFINRTEKPITLAWVSSGSRREYATLEPGKSHVQHTYDGHVWVAEDDDGETVGVYQAVSPPGAAVVDGSWEPRDRRRRGRGRQGDGQRDRGAASPDGRWRAEIQDDNVVLIDLESDERRQLTDDGTPDDAYRSRFFWSPDSAKLIVLREQPGQDREISFVESTPDDQLQPKLHTFEYVKPGDRLAKTRPCLFHIEDKEQVEVSDELFDNPWSIERFAWEEDSSRFTFLYNQRGHQVLRVVAIEAESGEATPLIDEQAETFLCYSSKLYLHRVADKPEWLWMSERDGWCHLYLVDEQGSVRPITSGEWAVRGVDRVDDEKRQVWFHAGGYDSDQDPYHVHHFRINYDGSGLVRLTEGDGTHDLTYSPDGRYYLDRYSRVDLAPVTELRRSDDGKLVCELERADWSDLLAAGWQPPLRFTAKGRDGQTDIYGIIHRPTNFDPEKEYPVIEAIYAGPHSAHVPKRFAPYHRAQAMAELGFILVQIDGMGTSHRSKAFHDVCWKNLGDAGFPDRVKWIKAAAQRYPWMDADRVGIYGGSAGGQNAMGALIFHGDFYDAAAADCGCHDNRMDKIWWNEQWMGWPVGPHYEAASNAAQAHRMQGHLLLTVGELDRNVDPASTMQVVDALIKADKDYELIVFPGGGHGAGGSRYGQRRMRDFFVRHLWDLEPRR
ncbi:Prolyl tripeptidyl peptidase precursor [Posidoniimonas corsicana]|uniref:Prolyl tripeptidyl peptidase n=1 Tax=Posidoniimonas corsicana TaxID=1938618 RepID=A0A5C5UU75_9BACT|nr:prolyl oligopeptidase family serine peptidase [Posidoniimonas corsicana]TWT29217.1 Prolyl tripeptidyl peptidase precursor [Posidoniimonas corsicana]